LAEARIYYFENYGKENTDRTLQIARQRADELGIKNIVVASTTGETGVKAMKVFHGLRVIVVTHSFGFKEANSLELTKENRAAIEDQGGTILTAAHAFGALSRSMRQGSITDAPQTYVIGDIVSATLRNFGQGVKVACEIAVMAADAGLVRSDAEIISVAGTNAGGGKGGADTAIVVQSAPAHNFFNLRVKEILCKPRL
jgi:hypothetical protein